MKIIEKINTLMLYNLIQETEFARLNHTSVIGGGIRPWEHTYW
jgi:hypothetical protein